MDSYKNGATSWIPHDVPKNVKIIVSITKSKKISEYNLDSIHLCPLSLSLPDESDACLPEVEKFISFSSDPECSNVLEIGELEKPMASKILQTWMKKINRSLTNHQVA